MLHPLADDPSLLTIPELHTKIQDLSSKYFKTTNPQVQQQIATFLEIYKQEVTIKEAKQQNELQQNGNLELDKLIKVS